MNETTYPSDLTDEEWEWIKDLIPAAKSGGRPRILCMRAVLNAIFYVTKGGIQWRMLPVNFPGIHLRRDIIWHQPLSAMA